MIRPLTIRFVVATFMFVFAAGTGVVARAGDKGPCQIATKGGSAPAKACAKGGRDEARKTMKAMVQQAKSKGRTFECGGCHKDLETYELTPNARADFKKLEAAQ